MTDFLFDLRICITVVKCHSPAKYNSSCSHVYQLFPLIFYFFEFLEIRSFKKIHSDTLHYLADGVGLQRRLNLNWITIVLFIFNRLCYCAFCSISTSGHNRYLSSFLLFDFFFKNGQISNYTLFTKIHKATILRPLFALLR